MRGPLILRFWYRLLVMSVIGFKDWAHHFPFVPAPVHKGFLGFVSGATPVNHLVASSTTKHSLATYSFFHILDGIPRICCS